VRALPIGLAVGAIAVSGLVLYANQDDECSFSQTTFDGTPIAGPADSETAMRQFLDDSADHYDLDPDIEDWIGAGHESEFTWQHDRTYVHTSRHSQGWAVTGIERTCE
jgi:hypothetical protein